MNYRCVGAYNDYEELLFMAKLKGYITGKTYQEFRDRYKECIRMLNGLEKTLERKVPQKDRRWQVSEGNAVYEADKEIIVSGWPVHLVSDMQNLTPET